MVALVQTAMALPMFFLALPAGALADIVDRRRLLMVGQSWMMLMALTLGILTILGWTTAWILLLITFCMGAGLAMSWPAFAATIPDLVPKNELLSAITLNGVAMNATRAVGPAIGGALIGVIGAGPIFLINGLTYTGILAALASWRRPSEKESPLPSERFVGAIRVGLRFALESPPLQYAILRGGLFFFAGVAVLALLPVIVRDQLKGSPAIFGLMLGAYGTGAILTAFVLPVLTRFATRDQVVGLSHFLFAAALALLSQAGSLPVAIPAVVLAGLSWLLALATLQVAVQTSLPSWVRARGLAIFLMVIMGSMAAGSAFWGLVARAFSIATSLEIAAVTLVLSAAATWRFSLSSEREDLTPIATWTDGGVTVSPMGHRGPVEVLVEYRIPDENREPFIAAMRDIRQIRRRNGAYSWALYEDINEPGTFIETFMDDSWHDHLRRRLRLTAADQAAQDRVNALQVTPGPPRVRQLLAQELPRPNRT